MADNDGLPQGIDPDKASVARMYDAMLGGQHNFPIDREALAAFTAIDPQVRTLARANRAFLGRAVRFLVEAGIRQFIDLGSGIPTQGNVHEVAQAASPDARVVYVDSDPVAVAHSTALLADNPGADIVDADIRRPADILSSPQVRKLIDFEQPVAVLMITILHFITPEENPAGIVAAFRDALPEELAGAHACDEPGSPRHGRRRGAAVPVQGHITGDRPLPRRDPGPLRRLRPGGARPGLRTPVAPGPGRPRPGEPVGVLGVRGRRPQACVTGPTAGVRAGPTTDHDVGRTSAACPRHRPPVTSGRWERSTRRSDGWGHGDRGLRRPPRTRVAGAGREADLR